MNSLAAALSEVLDMAPADTIPPAPDVQLASTSTPLAPTEPRAIDQSFAAVARELQRDSTYQKAAFRQYPQLEQFRS